MKLRSVLLGVAAIAISSLAYAQQPIVIAPAMLWRSTHRKGKAADFFALKAAELTKGRVKAEVYPNSQLYKDKKRWRHCKLALCRCWRHHWPNLGRSASRNSKFSTCRSCLTASTSYAKVTLGPVGAQLLAKLEPKGIKGLAYRDNGFKSLSQHADQSACRHERQKVQDSILESPGGRDSCLGRTVPR